MVRFSWPVQHVSWALVCGALWLAAGSKLVELSLFYRYVETVTTFPGWLVRIVAISLIVLEIGIPILSLHARFFSLAALSSVALFVVFLVFHLTRLWTGDPLPCSCFGSALQLTPGQFALIDTGLLFAGLCAWRFGAGNVAPSPKNLIMASSAWVPAILILLLVEVKTVASAGPSQAPKGSRRLAVLPDALLDGSTSVHSPGETKGIIVIFGDYECPYTQKLVGSQAYRDLLESKYVGIQWREFPLTRLHPRAMSFALHSKKANNRRELKQVQHNLVNLARSSQGSIEAVGATEVEVFEQQIREDIGLARKLDLDRTPVILVVTGNDVYEVLQIQSAIDLLGVDK